MNEIRKNVIESNWQIYQCIWKIDPKSGKDHLGVGMAGKRGSVTYKTYQNCLKYRNFHSTVLGFLSNLKKRPPVDEAWTAIRQLFHCIPQFGRFSFCSRFFRCLNIFLLKQQLYKHLVLIILLKDNIIKLKKELCKK